MSSRRRVPGGTGRPRLTRERVLDAALALIDREGLGALSMRRVADELDAGAMSLYRHVASREDLLDGVVERLAHEIELPGPEHGDWAQRMRTLMRSTRSVALGHPNAAELFVLRPLRTPAGRARMAEGLALIGAGLPPREAGVAARTLDSYVVGFILAELGGRPEFGGSDTGGDDEFDAGVELILGALQSRRAHSSP